MKLILLSFVALYFSACNKQAGFSGGAESLSHVEGPASRDSADAVVAEAYQGTTSVLASDDATYEKASPEPVASEPAITRTAETSTQTTETAAQPAGTSVPTDIGTSTTETTAGPSTTESAGSTSTETSTGTSTTESAGTSTTDTTGMSSTTEPPMTTTETRTTSPETSTTETTTTSPETTATESTTSSEGTTTTPPPADFKVEIQDDATAITEGSSSNISESELKGCQEYFNGEGRIVIYNNTGSIALGAQDILALKVTGNSQMVSVALSPMTAQETMLKVKGLCFFLAGNDARASVSLRGTALERIWNRALGNGAQTTVNVGANSSVGMFEIATNGNGSKLIVQGEGTYNCPNSHPYIECTP